MSSHMGFASFFPEGKANQLRKAFGIPVHPVSAMASNKGDRPPNRGTSSDGFYYTSGDETFDVEACFMPEITTVVVNASIATKSRADTETPNASGEVEQLAPDFQVSDEYDKPVATYEFVWHYEHNPVFIPQEITQNDRKSYFKELVQIYSIRDPWAKSRNETESSGETSDDDTNPSTHRAEVCIFRNNEKRVTFGCHFDAAHEAIKDVKFIKSESIFADGSRWPFFEDSRSLEDLDLRLRCERDENGYHYIEFIVRQKTHRDSSNMPQLTVLGRRVVPRAKPLHFSEEEALDLIRRQTPEPYEIEEAPGTGETSDNDEEVDSGEVTDIDEEVQTEWNPRARA